MVQRTARKPRLGLGVPRRRRSRVGVPWVRIDPAIAGYPWEAAGLHPANFPTPSLFWDANETTQWLEDPHFDEVVRAALGSALLMAGADPELATSRTSQGRRLRQQMRRVILEAPHNDLLYGCTNANLCGGFDPSMPGSDGRTHEDLHVMGPKGRGLHWGAVHANNRERIARGKAVARAITDEGEPFVPNEMFSRPLLWIPAVSLEALTGDAPRVTTKGMTWSDNASTSHVPPQVRALGLLDDVREGDP